MQGTLEDAPTESMEKWPPGWANHEYDPDDLDEEQDNKR